MMSKHCQGRTEPVKQVAKLLGCDIDVELLEDDAELARHNLARVEALLSHAELDWNLNETL